MKQQIKSNFIDKAKMDLIESHSDKKRYLYCTFYMAVFSLCAGTFPTFTGYSFENAIMIFAFVCEIFVFLLFFRFYAKLILLEKKHPVFKKKWYPHIFAFGYLSLSVTFAIVAIFATKFTSESPNTFSIKYNPVYYYFVFLPLFFSYLIFCYYTFMKVFAKCWRKNKQRNGDQNMF